MRACCRTNSPEETEALGQRIGRLLRPGDVVALTGGLGSGKTCLARGVARGCGVVEPSVVCSPTFVLVQEYDAFRSLPDGGRRAFTLYHLDLYRLRSPEELADIGGDDILNGDGVCVVEWAERAGPLLPPGTLRVQLEVLSERSRRVTLTADDDRFADCAQGRSAS